MNYIQGKNFMFYVECKTLTDSLMVPLCSVENVSLQMQSDIREATKEPTSKWGSFYYGKNSYSLNLDGLISYSKEQVQALIVEVNGQLLAANDKLVSVGSVPVGELSPYFCLENALADWQYLNWYCEDQDNPGYKYKGTILVEQLSNTWTPNDNRKFSGSLRGDGELQRFHTPAPTDLKKEGQSNTLPDETVSILNITPTSTGDGNWKSGFTISGTYLPSGIFASSVGGSYQVEPGDTLPEITQALVQAIAEAATPGVIDAYADDDTVYVIRSNSTPVTGTYTDHFDTLRSVFLSFQSQPYDYYRVKVEQGSDEWIIDVQGTQPTIVLPTGTYTVSVAGMGSDMKYSDYSETINITVA